MEQYTFNLALDILSDQFLQEPTDENGDKLIKEICRLIQGHKQITIDLIEQNQQTQPSGYMAEDGKFYVHIFSSEAKFLHSTAAHPGVVDMAQLYQSMCANPIIGGFSLNHQKKAI